MSKKYVFGTYLFVVANLSLLVMGAAFWWKNSGKLLKKNQQEYIVKVLS